MPNVFDFGTFEGMLDDWDGDGHFDPNSRNVHSTANGKPDANMDGVPARPGATEPNGELASKQGARPPVP